MEKFTLIFILALGSTPAFAEKWTNVGTFTTVEFGQTRIIDVYGDSDSALRTGDFAKLIVRGFGSDQSTTTTVMFECIKKEIIVSNQRIKIDQDYKDGSAIISATVMLKLHAMACKKWFEVWK